jgi:hypothetical protein
MANERLLGASSERLKNPSAACGYESAGNLAKVQGLPMAAEKKSETVLDA